MAAPAPEGRGAEQQVEAQGQGGIGQKAQVIQQADPENRQDLTTGFKIGRASCRERVYVLV